MEVLGVLLILLSLVCIPAFLIAWFLKRRARLSAGEDFQTDLNYLKKSKFKRLVGIVGIASFVLGIVFVRLGQPSAEEIAAMEKESREKLVAELAGDEKTFYDTKFNEYLSSGKTEEDAQKLAVDDIKSKRAEEKRIADEKAEQERLAKEAEEKKLAEEKAAQEKLAAEQKAQEEKLAAEKKAQEEKLAAEKKAQEEKLAAEQKAEQERLAAEQKKYEEEQKKFAEVREELAKWEREGKLQYQYLRNGAVNVILTERANFHNNTVNSSRDLGELIGNVADYASHDDHERNIISTSIQCMEMVQKVKDAGLNVNNFEIHLRGDVVDAAGYKSVDDVVICEISGSKNFKRDDPYSFYNATDRYWTINGL